MRISDWSSDVCSSDLDPERLFQVLSNLIGNAIKFTPQQGSVGISAMSVGDEIVFSVRDTGEGIKPAQLPHEIGRASCRERCVSTWRSRWSPIHSKNSRHATLHITTNPDTHTKP